MLLIHVGCVTRILDRLSQGTYIRLQGLPAHRGRACSYTNRPPEKQGKRACDKERSTMRLSTKGRYAVMAMADLAGSMRRRTSPVSLADIAQRQEISLSYLEQLFAKLRRGGLVNSVRGPGGGYRLSPSVRRIAHRRHHRGGGRADCGHALQAGQRQGLHRPRARAASPMICGKNWAARSTFSCRPFRWPMWSRSACWAADPAVLGGEQQRTARSGLSPFHP